MKSVHQNCTPSMNVYIKMCCLPAFPTTSFLRLIGSVICIWYMDSGIPLIWSVKINVTIIMHVCIVYTYRHSGVWWGLEYVNVQCVVPYNSYKKEGKLSWAGPTRHHCRYVRYCTHIHTYLHKLTHRHMHVCMYDPGFVSLFYINILV